MTEFVLRDFSNLPETKGLYAWFVRPREEADLLPFHSFFRSRVLECEISGNLSMSFHGQLEEKFKQNFETTSNSPLITEAFKLFCPPIYIGITERTLNERLNEHKKTLIRVLESKEINFDYPDHKNDLGFRIARTIIANKLDLDETNFFVRIKEAPNSSKKEINECENFLNRTFSPLLGRR